MIMLIVFLGMYIFKNFVLVISKLKVYILTWIRVWMFTWHIEILLPWNLTVLCKRIWYEVSIMILFCNLVIYNVFFKYYLVVDPKKMRRRNWIRIYRGKNRKTGGNLLDRNQRERLRILNYCRLPTRYVEPVREVLVPNATCSIFPALEVQVPSLRVVLLPDLRRLCRKEGWCLTQTHVRCSI